MFLGFGGVLLALWGLRRWRRRAYPWLVVAVTFWIVGLGPQAHIWGRGTFNSWAVMGGGGPPGSGWEAPVSNHLIYRQALNLLGIVPGAGVESLTSPLYIWARKHVSLLGPFSVPIRAGAIVVLVAALLSGAGWEALHERARTKPAWWAVGAGLLVLLVVERAYLGYPTTDPKMDPFYYRLAKEPGQFAVIEVPLHELPPGQMMAQVVHGRPLFLARHSRPPADAHYFVRRNEILRRLESAYSSTEREDRYTLPQLSQRGAKDQQWRTARRQSEQLRVRYVLVHPAQVWSGQRKSLEYFLAHTVGLPEVYRSGELVVYRVY